MKNQNFEKMRKFLEISSFHTCVPKITIIWCTVPEIQSETHRIFCHYGSFFYPYTPLIPKIKIFKKWRNVWSYYPFTHVYHKWRSYDIWFLKYKVWQTEFFVILGYFCTFTPPGNPENQNFEKNWKKYLGILSF